MDPNQRPDIPVSEQIISRGTPLDDVVHGDCGHEQRYADSASAQQNLFTGPDEQSKPLPPNNYTIFVELLFEDEEHYGAKCEITYEDGQPSKIVMSSEEHGGQRLEDDVFSIGFFAFVSAVARMGNGQANLGGPMNLHPYLQQQAMVHGGAMLGRRQAVFGPGGQPF